MPLITIKSFPPADPAVIAGMLSKVQEKGAAALNCPSSNIWVVFEPISPGHYLQSNSHPPIVIIRAQSGRTNEQRKALVFATVQSVSQGLSVPTESVWVHYQEMRPEDVWFENRWSG